MFGKRAVLATMAPLALLAVHLSLAMTKIAPYVFAKRDAEPLHRPQYVLRTLSSL